MALTRFIKRAISYVGEIPTNDYLELMFDTYSEALPFNENNRVIYFFPQNKALAAGGQDDSVLVGLGLKNGSFENLSTVGTPSQCEVVNVNIGNKTFEAALFTPSYTEPAFYMEFTSSDYSNKADFEAYIRTKLSTGNSTVVMDFSSEGNMIACNFQVGANFINNAFLNDTKVVQVIDWLGQIGSVGNSCFQGATSLTGTLLPSITTISQDCFNGCINYINNQYGIITSIGNNAYKNCTAFEGSTSFDFVETLGISAFEGCSSLLNVSFGNVTTMGASCFKSCTDLTTIYFNSLAIIPNNAFEGCTSLQTANIANANNTQHSCFKNCSSLVTVNMPNIQSVADSAFQNCTSITSINFQSALTVGLMAFMGCTSITEILLINATSLANRCFENCSSCENINILAATSIGSNNGNNRVFYGCTYSGLTIIINVAAQADKDITDAGTAGATIIVD